MKKILLIALLLIPFIGISQTTKPIEGFLGIKFGASKAEVVSALKAKGGQLRSDKGDEIVFDGLKLGERKTVGVFINFIDGKVYHAQFAFKIELEAEVIGYYNSLVKDLSDVYGPGKVIKTFDDPYTEDDGYNTQAISLGKGHFNTNWKSDNSNFIDAFIPTDLTVRLEYFDSKLNDLVEQKKKEQKKSDM